MDQEVECKKRRLTEDVATVSDEEGGDAQNEQSPTKNMSPKKLTEMADDNDGGEETDGTTRIDESTDDQCTCAAEEEKKQMIWKVKELVAILNVSEDLRKLQSVHMEQQRQLHGQIVTVMKQIVDSIEVKM